MSGGVPKDDREVSLMESVSGSDQKFVLAL